MKNLIINFAIKNMLERTPPHRIFHAFRFFAASTPHKSIYNRPYILISKKYLSSLDTPEERERAEKWLQRFSKDNIPRGNYLSHFLLNLFIFIISTLFLLL